MIEEWRVGTPAMKWKHLLRGDEMKIIIIKNFQWLVQHELVYLTHYMDKL